MQKPYVAQDDASPGGGGWWADCLGVMQDPNPERTKEQAMQWVIDRMWHVLYHSERSFLRRLMGFDDVE